MFNLQVLILIFVARRGLVNSFVLITFPVQNCNKIKGGGSNKGSCHEAESNFFGYKLIIILPP